MAKTTCEYCSWKPGQNHIATGCPKTVLDPEKREVAVRAWRIGYSDAVYNASLSETNDVFYWLGYSRGQEDISKAEAIDLDQIKPVKFDGKVIDDLFAGL